MKARGPRPDQAEEARTAGHRGAIVAGFAYFGVVFCIGFAFGAIRSLVLAPLIGEVSAVCLEAPIMLAVSWLVCGWSTRQFGVGPDPMSRLAMGAIAFALLMAAEFGYASLIFARAPMSVLQTYRTLAGAIGLASQIGFALIPLLRGRLSRAPL